MLVVAALGGNALLKRGEAPSPEVQRANLRPAARALAGIVHAGHRLVVTHGNGPQIGLMAMRQALATDDAVEPLDILGAQTEGLLGYLIEQELENALSHRIPVATLLTQVEVDPADPAFARPDKFIGPVFDAEQAGRLSRRHGWSMAQDGDHWRRVVASPRPVGVPDLELIRLLSEHGAVVICAGGGGIPVAARSDGRHEGVEAVVDKDRVSALIATQLKAEVLLLLTDVRGVHRNWPDHNGAPIRTLSAHEAGKLDLPAGSMGPKVEAACTFVDAGGDFAGIGRLSDAAAILERRSGTIVVPDDGAGPRTGA